MRSCPPRPAAKHSGGFTLVELLVVIAIIGVLAAILSSVLGKVQSSARKVQVVNDMRNLRIATNSYFLDYRHLPITPQQQMAVENLGYDTVYGDPNGIYKNRDLIDVLRAISDGSRYNQNNELNPSKTVYWEGQPAKNPTKPVNGVTIADYTTDKGELVEKGSFIDSWGHPYVM